jgi:exopolysaccharide biosynthesis protein
MLRLERNLRTLFAAVLAIFACSSGVRAGEVIEHPFRGVTTIARTESAPRDLTIHVVTIDLTAPGIAFKLTPPGGALETVRQTTLDFLKQEHAQIAINGHFFLPFPSPGTDADVIGFAASNGAVYSAFETPVQSYAIVDHAPAINFDRSNHAGIVHCDRRFADGKHLLEKARVWNAFAGSAQIITNGVKTIPSYSRRPDSGAALTPGGPRDYSDTNSWYDALQARTVIGLSRNRKTLCLFTVDRAGGSLGMRVGEVADLLIRDYGVYNALNLDGGGSTSMAMEDPITHQEAMVNRSSDRPEGRAVGSNLAVFARPARGRVR